MTSHKTETMCAVRPNAGRGGVRDMRVAVIASRPADGRRIALMLDGAVQSRFVVANSDDLTTFLTSGAAAGVDIAVVMLESHPTEAVKAQINRLARSTGVALVGDPAVVLKLMAPDGMRARVCLPDEDLTPEVLEAALIGLLCARASEDRLLRVVADQARQVREMHGAGARLIREVGIAGDAFNVATREVADLPLNPGGVRAMALAADAIAGLEEASGEFKRAITGLAAQQALLRPANLNNVIEAFVKNISGAGASKVSALTSFSPIFVHADGASVWRLLDGVLRSWRVGRAPTDRLELLCWDSGAEAKLAVVMSRSGDDLIAMDSGPADKSAGSKFLRRLRQDIAIHADECAARIEIERESPAATMLNLTLALQKKSNAPGYLDLGAAPKTREVIAAPL
jgi:hypothetical protein